MALHLVTDGAPASVDVAGHIRPDEATRALADYHRQIAAQLPPESRVRGLALRAAGHWDRIGHLDDEEAL